MPDADSTFKSAREEASKILEAMSIGEFRKFLVDNGYSAVQKRDESDKAFQDRVIKNLLKKYDHNRKSEQITLPRNLGIPIDEERRLNLMYEATIAARDSADASARSAKSARYIVRVSFAAALIAVGSLVVSFVAVCKDS